MNWYRRLSYPVKVGVAIGLLWLVWLLYAILYTNLDTRIISSLGTLGDSFGVVNSLFASLALVFTVITNQMQSRQLGDLAKDRKLQYYKQLHDLYFLDKKVSEAYYLIEHDIISFFPKSMLEGGSEYWVMRDRKCDAIELKSSIDALLSVADLTVQYIENELVESGEHFEYRIRNIVNNVHIMSYLRSLKEYNKVNGFSKFPFPNLCRYLQNNRLLA